MAGKDKVWDKVEAFIREQGFACDNEHIPVVSRKYRKDVDGLQVVIEPVFTDKGRGRLRFVCTAVAVYEGERHLTGFAWYPQQPLSQAMGQALRQQMEWAQSELRLAEEQLAVITRDGRLCQGLTDWVQRLTYSTTTDRAR